MLFRCVLISGAIIHFLLSRNYFLATIFYKSSILSTFKFCDRFIISESRAFNFIKKSNRSFFEGKLSIFLNHHKFGSEKNTKKYNLKKAKKCFELLSIFLPIIFFFYYTIP